MARSRLNASSSTWFWAASAVLEKILRDKAAGAGLLFC